MIAWVFDDIQTSLPAPRANLRQTVIVQIVQAVPHHANRAATTGPGIVGAVQTSAGGLLVGMWWSLSLSLLLEARRAGASAAATATCADGSAFVWILASSLAMAHFRGEGRLWGHVFLGRWDANFWVSRSRCSTLVVAPCSGLFLPLSEPSSTSMVQ